MALLFLFHLYSTAVAASTYSGVEVTEVQDSNGRIVAVFTTGARTVTLLGPPREFAEQGPRGSATHRVRHSAWVRLLPHAFSGQVDKAWLERALLQNARREADILTVATEYLNGAPAVVESGLRIAGDASYGPLLANGMRQEGSDFFDYLGVSWNFADGHAAPIASQFGSLDCSGFVRMIFGFRFGYPLAYGVHNGHLPRRAVQMYRDGPGVLLVNEKTKPSIEAVGLLRAGDLLFFDVSSDDGEQIDHVGIYLGVDIQGQHRFLSSRKGINGPTFGDFKGASVIFGEGLYSKGLRAVRRL